VYIEESKQTRNRAVYEHVLTEFLKLIAPIMPFVTEQIWCTELGRGTTLLTQTFPTPDPRLSFPSVPSPRAAADPADPARRPS
jgi:valyl-tRNA synthetase